MPAVSSSLLVWSEQLRLNPVMGTAVLTGPWICRENLLFKVVVTLGVITWWPPELRSPEYLKISYMSLGLDGIGSSGENT